MIQLSTWFLLNVRRGELCVFLGRYGLVIGFWHLQRLGPWSLNKYQRKVWKRIQRDARINQMQNEDKTKISRKPTPTPGQIMRVVGWLVAALKAAPATERIAHVVVLVAGGVAVSGLYTDPTNWQPTALLALCVVTEGAIVFSRRFHK